MESIKEVLMNRDGITAEEADQLIGGASYMVDKAIEDGEFDAADLNDICYEWLGLEMDYNDL